MITFENNIVTQRLENLKKEFQALIEKKKTNQKTPLETEYIPVIKTL